MSEPPSAMGWAIEETLAAHGEVSFTARGRSMLPIILPGSRVTIVACAMTDLQAGDVVLFRTQGAELMLHRLLAIQGGRLRTRGDNQQGVLEVPGTALLGRLSRCSLGALGPSLDLPEQLRQLGGRRIKAAALANRAFRLCYGLSAPARALWRSRRRRPPVQ